MNTMPYERSQNLEIPMKSLKMVQPQTFGGNKATRKTKKNLLKQQYGNFKAEGKKTLEQTFNRLHAIVNHLEFMDVEIEQDDLNQKLLTSLTPEWLMHTIVWRNKSDLDTMSLDDLYNHLKWEWGINTNSIPTANTQVSPVSANVTPASISLDTACAYSASQSNSSHIKAPRSQERGRKENYKQGTKEEEQAPKALMVIDGVGWDWSYMENEEENHALVADEEAPTEFALMAKSSTDNDVFDNSLCFKACKKNTDSLNKTLKKENEGLDSKLTSFKSASKDLDSLLESQRSDKNKEGLGYSVVHLPPTQVYSPPKKDMSWTGLPEFANDIITDYTRPFLSVESNPNDLQNNSSSVFEIGESNGSILSKPEIKFVKAADSLTVVKANKDETVRKTSVKYVEMYRKTSKRSNVK
nr:hypothetical protein [Tanacetum cinerariifolium]